MDKTPASNRIKANLVITPPASSFELSDFSSSLGLSPMVAFEELHDLIDLDIVKRVKYFDGQEFQNYYIFTEDKYVEQAEPTVAFSAPVQAPIVKTTKTNAKTRKHT